MFTQGWNATLNDVTMTSSPIWILSNSNTNLPRAYLSDTLNFILIRHKKAEIQSREINREQEAFRERRHFHICNLWPWIMTLTLSQVKKVYVIIYCLLYCALVPGMMSVNVIVWEMWPLIHFCYLWPSLVTFSLCQGHLQSKQ